MSLPIHLLRDLPRGTGHWACAVGPSSRAVRCRAGCLFRWRPQPMRRTRGDSGTSGPARQPLIALCACCVCAWGMLDCRSCEGRRMRVSLRMPGRHSAPTVQSCQCLLLLHLLGRWTALKCDKRLQAASSHALKCDKRHQIALAGISSIGRHVRHPYLAGHSTQFHHCADLQHRRSASAFSLEDGRQSRHRLLANFAGQRQQRSREGAPVRAARRRASLS